LDASFKVRTNSSTLSMHLFIIISLVLFSPNTLPNVVSALASPQEPVYLIRYVVNTTSDWCDVTLDGPMPFACNASIQSGEQAPNLRYSYGSGHIWIAKQQYDQTPVSMDCQVLALTGSVDGLISIDSGALGETTIDIYYYSGSWAMVSSITHLGLYEREDFTVDYSTVYASPFGSAEVEPVPPSLKNTVYAFYYPWYTVQEGSGGVTAWGRVPPHEPLMGHYSSYDERAIEAHILMAKAAGIDGFLSSWGGLGFMEEEILPKILSIAERLNFKITIYYESQRGAYQLTPQEIVDELDYIVRTYSASDAFLKVDGVPVIFIYAINAYERSASFWREVTENLETSVGQIFLVGDLTEEKHSSYFDGIHWYPVFTLESAQDVYDRYTNHMGVGAKNIDWSEAVELIQQGETLPLRQRYLAFTIGPGYDMRNLGYPDYMDRRDGQAYTEYWQEALSCDPDGVLITSWNEWWEGTEIEPSTEHGFSYVNLTSHYTSLYKGVTQQTASPSLIISSDLGNAIRSGTRNTSFHITNASPNGPAVCVNMTLSLGEGLRLTDSSHSAFESYVEAARPQRYSVLIPLLRPLEEIPVNITFTASAGSRNLNVAARGFSASGEPAQASMSRQVQVFDDRVIVSLEPNLPRVDAGSTAQITISAHYELDGEPLSGEVHLNDTLTKSSTGSYAYTAESVSDELYGLTGFSSNTVTVIFDRIISGQTAETLRPGTITVNVALTYESDESPVDDAEVTVNGLTATEESQGNYQAAVTTWSPLYQLDITVEKPGFAPQSIALSGLALGNILLIVTMLILVTILILILLRC